MEKYKGSITTTGNSGAIQIEKNLFNQHPEFAQKSKVLVSFIGPGNILISLQNKEINPVNKEADPILTAFLAFLEQDMINNPNNIKVFLQSNFDKSRELTLDVNVSDDDIISDDISL